MAVVAGFIGGALGFGSAGIFAAGAAFAATTWGGIAVKLLTSVALSALSRSLMETPKQEVAGLRTSTTLSGGVNPDAFCIGPYATDGAFVGPPMSCDASGGNTPMAILHYVIELAGSPRHGLDGMIIDGEVAEILPDHIHPDHGNRIGGRFLGKAWVRYYDGTQTAADPYLVSRYPIGHVRPWTPDMVGHGICYAIVTFLYDREVWTGWPKARFILRGLPLYDPRSDSTAGGLGPMRWGQESTYLPTRNPAIMLHNILRGIRMAGGQVWGGEATAEDLPFDDWAAAMDACAEMVDDGAGGMEPRYRAGFEIFTEDEPFAVIEKLLRACNGQLTEHGGIWRLRVGGPGLPVRFITDDDILIDAPQELDPFPAPDEIYNAISATYPDPSRLWETSETPLLTNEDWEEEDGNRRLPVDLAFDAAPYPLQVQRIIAALIKDHRRLLRHMLTLPPEAGVLELGDVIAWTSAANGYAAKLFEVSEVVRDPRTWRTRVSLREVDPEDYDPPEGLVLPSPPSLEVVRPAAQAVPGWDAMPTIIVDAESNARRPAARAVWDAAGAVDARGVRVAVRLAGEAGEGRELGIYDLRAGEALLDPALPATAYEMRGRLVVDRATDWTAWTAVTTPDVRITDADLAEDLGAILATLDGWISGGVSDLPDDLSMLAGSISAEIDARVAAVSALADQMAAEAQMAAARWRDYGDRIHALAAEVLDLASADFTAREELRQQITVRIEGARAEYTDLITVLADASTAVAQRVTTLEADTGDLSSAILTAEQARVDGDEALALMIATMSVGSAVMFDHAAIWYFDAGIDGWTGGSSAPTASGGWLIPAASDHIVSPAGLGVDGDAYMQVRARLRRTGTPVWTGQLWWAAAGQSWDPGRRVTIAEPAWDGDEAIVTIGPGWTGQVDRIRLDLSTGGNDMALDWIAVGRPAPGASSADLAAERQARISGDAAVASDVLALEARQTAAETTQAATTSAVEVLETRTGATESGLAAAGTRLTGIETQIADPATGLAALAGAIDLIEAGVAAGEAGTSIVAEAVRSLRSSYRAMADEALEATARGVLDDWRNRDLIASATQTLTTRIDMTDDQVALVAQAVTALQSAIPGLATADALAALETIVTQHGLDITSAATDLTSLAASLTDLSGVVGTKADATALEATTATVTQQGGRISAIVDALSKLGATVGASTAETLFRMTAEATPEGALARIGLKAVASGSEADARAAALFLEAVAGDKSRVVVQGDAFYVMIGASSIPLFVVEAGVIRLNAGLIRLSGDVTVDGSFTVTGSMIAPNAVTHAIEFVGWDAPLDIGSTDTAWVTGPAGVLAPYMPVGLASFVAVVDIDTSGSAPGVPQVFGLRIGSNPSIGSRDDCLIQVVETAYTLSGGLRLQYSGALYVGTPYRYGLQARAVSLSPGVTVSITLKSLKFTDTKK
ncbi:hypothetical protein [Pseudogemmobacter sonorensis]|uniref:hypothetical protein n=1 Tax=Pseudogemmobacter sonorensis TaxID=2989681 RepID=UPI0036A80D60